MRQELVHGKYLSCGLWVLMQLRGPVLPRHTLPLTYTPASKFLIKKACNRKFSSGDCNWRRLLLTRHIPPALASLSMTQHFVSCSKMTSSLKSLLSRLDHKYAGEHHHTQMQRTTTSADITDSESRNVPEYSGRGDGKTGKLLAVQESRPKFGSPAPTKIRYGGIHNHRAGEYGRQRKSGSHWLASLAKKARARARKRPGLKNKVENDKGRHLMLTSGLHRCITGEDKHTHIHAYTQGIRSHASTVCIIKDTLLVSMNAFYT